MFKSLLLVLLVVDCGVGREIDAGRIPPEAPFGGVAAAAPPSLNLRGRMNGWSVSSYYYYSIKSGTTTRQPTGDR